MTAIETIPLDVIAQDYLQMSPYQARAKAKEGKLPFPAFSVTESQKSKWLVRADDFNAHLLKRYEEAKSDWAAQKSHKQQWTDS